MTRDPVIVSAVRTPIGRAIKGSLKDVRPDDLLALAVGAAAKQVKQVLSVGIDDVVAGCSFPEGEQGYNIARVSALIAGLGVQVPGCTVNRHCASSLQAIVYACQSIRFGSADVVVAAGVESMSRVPMRGFNFSPNPVLDSVNGYIPMGLTAENVAERYGVSREQQDRFALESHEKAMTAWNAGKFSGHIVPVPASLAKRSQDTEMDGQSSDILLEKDECPRSNTSMEVLGKLRPIFREGGTVTAGNSSPLSDGAAAMVITSREVAQTLGIQPLATVRHAAVTGVEPAFMGIGPISAVNKLLQRSALSLDAIGLVEVNEAFASQAIACVNTLGIKTDRLNANGGAIALGHPLGDTGCRIMVDLVHEMQRRGVRYGLETMCIGGGQGMAVIVEAANA